MLLSDPCIWWLSGASGDKNPARSEDSGDQLCCQHRRPSRTLHGFQVFFGLCAIFGVFWTLWASGSAMLFYFRRNKYKKNKEEAVREGHPSARGLAHIHYTVMDREGHGGYTVKKCSRVSSLQPGCHLPNSPWAGIIQLWRRYSRPGRVWYWHPGWGRETLEPFFTV